MRSLVFVIIALAATAAAQQEWSPETQLDGGVSQVLQSIYIPPIKTHPSPPLCIPSGRVHSPEAVAKPL
jgi:hypothetical protein